MLSLRSLNLFFLSDRSDRSDHMKPGFTVINRWKDLQQAREIGRFIRRIGPRRLFTLGYLGLEPTTTLHAQAYLTFFGWVLCCQCMATTRHTAYNFTFYRERKQKKTNLSLLLSFPLDIVLVTIIENTVQLRSTQWTVFSHLQVFLWSLMIFMYSLMHSANYPYLSEGKDNIKWFCHKLITLRLHIIKVKTKAMLSP